MSTADDPERPPPADRSDPASRHGHPLVAVLVLGAVVLVLVLTVLVSECGRNGDSEIYRRGVLSLSAGSSVQA
jgi:hypothetical protein